MAPPDLSMLRLDAATPAAVKVVRADSQAKGAREKGKKKKVKLSQKQIDVFMEMTPPRPLPRLNIDSILALEDPEDPELLEIGLELFEACESCVAGHQAWQDEKKSIREQFLTTGEAFIEVTDDEADIEVTDDEAE